MKTSGDPSDSAPTAQGLKRDRPESELDRSLLSLGEKSLAEGRPKEAAARFQRVLKRSPDSASARRGLARAELAQGNLDAAREWLGPASSAVGNTALLRTWAEIYRREGDSEAERGALEGIVAVDPARYTAHQRLADLTGPAPPSVSGSVDARLLRARQHPYDAKALLGGARAALSEGDEKTAGRWLTRLVWLADVDPGASRAAIQELSEIDPAWKDRIVVPVHVYADQSVRDEPGWRARMRLVWRSLSVALDPLLQLLFIPVSISEFDSSGSSSTLTGIEQAFRRTAGVLPSSGMIAAFTDRQPPEGGGMWRLGVAEFLGRVMVMRLAPGEISSRTLAHEAMHIFGAVHVSDERGSLMNPSGNSLNIDPSNIEITRLLRTPPVQARRDGRECDSLRGCSKAISSLCWGAFAEFEGPIAGIGRGRSLARRIALRRRTTRPRCHEYGYEFRRCVGLYGSFDASPGKARGCHSAIFGGRAFVRSEHTQG